MKKKKEIPTNDPTKKQVSDSGDSGQRGTTRDRSDIKKIETDYNNPNNGPQQKSQNNK
ncbi:hypothetical protein Q0590_08640 [Rhodocytophaga aerolata]|uniref:Glycogen biosynthesis protein GlgD n=1 Tax=Rhodocytophaga aerolata TaxID=455078 RepID=A0ABT8R2J8_9BACT|nr:hypothetical protein [Rhodocytophaga aerolata]MDO1446317.1 hypothetical protein [Rhodocytophaga aerolata]